MSWGRPENTLDYLRLMCLAPLTLFYKGALNLHKLAYQLHWLRSCRLPCSVISVGNITVGGTGKTPIIIDLASRLLANNIRVAILSRGYKRTNSSQCTVVSNGQNNFASLDQAGDEALMIAKAIPNAVVIVNQDRFTAGEIAVHNYKSQVLLLDDGYQHWRLQRDYNIVLIDYNDAPWHDSLLPAGRLREPLSALNRASHVIITKIPDNYDPAKLQKLKNLVIHYSPKAQISTCQFKPTSIQQLIAGRWTAASLDKLRDLPVIAFCGIAKPGGFFALINQLGAKVLDHISFADHHHYSQKDLNTLANKLKQSELAYLITTRKDLIKLESAPFASRLLALNLETIWLDKPPDILANPRPSASEKAIPK